MQDATPETAQRTARETARRLAEQHPMWETQVELERGMLATGAEAVRDRVIEATERGKLTRLDPVRGLLQEWLPGAAKELQNWVRVMSVSEGGKPISLAPLKACDPYVTTAIALRSILDSLTDDRRALVGLATAIGRTVEHEAQVRAWEKNEPALYHAQANELERNQSTDAHRRRVNINRFNELLEKGLFKFEWHAWGDTLHFRVGVTLIECIIRSTGWFELASDPMHVYRKGGVKKAPIVLVPKQALLDWLGTKLERQETTSPAYTPTVVPPRHWDGTRDGGYHTPYVMCPRLIAFKASQEQQREGAADEYEAIDMPEVYKAIHMLQEVPWHVNHKVYLVATAIDDLDLGIAGICAETPKALPFKPADIEADPEAFKLWRRAASKVHKANSVILSQTRGSKRTLTVATDYLNFERIYFPHKLDFRGRIYPIPVALQPQGDDLARGLLEFAEGKAIETPEARKWLAIQLASKWGWDKKSFSDRVRLVEENEALWRSIVEDPLDNRQWAAADKPFQALAAIYDWVAFLDEGYGYISHAPISVDGTCNGIQHLSAMVRDQEAGAYVNLTPATTPQDIYKLVASRLQGAMERIVRSGGEQGDLALYWLAICEGELPRTLTKRPVMVLPYGATREAYFKYTRAWLDEHDPIKPEQDTDFGRALRNKRLVFCVSHMWDTVASTVTAGLGVMRWLRECALHAATGNQPIFWRTPSGFVVRHFYGKRKEHQVKIKLDGAVYQVVMAETTAALDTKGQLLGISPNFVHSIDAATLVLCVNRCAARGVTAFAAIHDDYGTHAADMEVLSTELREAFIGAHEVDVLAQFRDACLAVMVAEAVDREGLDPLEASEAASDTLPPLPVRGLLNLQLVRASDYFFA